VGRLANIFGPLIEAFLLNQYGDKSASVYLAVVWCGSPRLWAPGARRPGRECSPSSGDNSRWGMHGPV
jgi:hypothetical protein